MVSIDAIIAGITSVAQSAAPFITGAPEAIKLGQDIIGLIDKVQDAFADEDVTGDLPALLEQRHALERRVTAHVESTAAKLRGPR